MKANGGMGGHGGQRCMGNNRDQFVWVAMEA